MFDRPQTGCFSSQKTQVNSCISQNDFPVPQYVNISSIRVNLRDTEQRPGTGAGTGRCGRVASERQWQVHLVAFLFFVKQRAG